MNLTKTTAGFVTVQNDVRLSVPDNPSTGIQLKYNGSSVALTPQGGTLTKAAELEDNAVTYPDYFGEGMSLRYTPTLSGLKEDILLSEYTGVHSFTFLLDTGGLEIYQSEGRYYLAETETAAQRIDMGDIVAFDARGRFSLGTMTVETLQVGQQYRLTLSVDPAFLTAESTTYPVMIDPTLTVDYDTYGSNAIEDVSIYSGCPNVNGDWVYSHCGYYDDTYKVARTLVRLPGLLRSSAYCSQTDFSITKVEFHIREASGTGSCVVPLYANAGNTSWTESGATWNNADAILGTQYAAASPSYGNDAVYDITQLVKAWQNGTISANAGFVLRNSDESINEKAFYSAEYSTVSYRPYAVVTYDIISSSGTGGGADFASATDICLDSTEYIKTVNPNEKRYFKFVPPVDGSYLFYSTRISGDPHIRIYNSSQSAIISDNNTGGNLNFRMVLELQAGSTFYLAAGHNGTENGAFYLNVLIAATNIGVPGGHLRNEGSSLYVDIHGPVEQDLVHQWGYHNGAQSRWTITKQSDGYYTLRSGYGNQYYLGIADTNIGTDNIHLYPTISDNTRWKIYSKSTGELFLEPKTASGKVLYAPNNTAGYELQLTYISASVSSRNKWKVEFQSDTALEGQRRSRWCWATASRMFENHYLNVPTSRTQNTAVTLIKGTPINEDGTYSEAIKAANYYSTGSTSSNTHELASGFGEIFSASALRSILNGGDILFISRGNYYSSNRRNGGHALAIVGYTTSFINGIIDYRYFVYDPWPSSEPDPWDTPVITAGQAYLASYTWICNGRNRLSNDPLNDIGIWEGYIILKDAHPGATVDCIWNS